MTAIQNDKFVKLFFKESPYSGSWKFVCATRRQKNGMLKSAFPYFFSASSCCDEMFLWEGISIKLGEEFSTIFIWLNTWFELFCLRLQPVSIRWSSFGSKRSRWKHFHQNVTKIYGETDSLRWTAHSQHFTSFSAIVLHSWTHLITQYFAVFAALNGKEDEFVFQYKSVLLALSPLLNERILYATSYQKTLSTIISL